MVNVYNISPYLKLFVNVLEFKGYIYQSVFFFSDIFVLSDFTVKGLYRKEAVSTERFGAKKLRYKNITLFV